MADRRDKARVCVALLVGGMVLMLAGLVWPLQPFFFIVMPLGMISVLVGGLYLRGRGAGVALVTTGFVSGLVFFGLRFALWDEGARPGVVGWTLLIVAGLLAVGGIVGGVAGLIWPQLLGDGSGDRRRTARPRISRPAFKWNKRTVGLTVVAVGGLAVIASIAVSYQRPSLLASMPLVGGGFLLLLVGNGLQGRRGWGLNLVIMGTLCGLAAVIWFTLVMYSEYDPTPLWPAYVLGSVAAITLVSGSVLMLQGRVARSAAGKGESSEAGPGDKAREVTSRETDGIVFLVGGLLAMCAGMLASIVSKGLLVLLPIGAIAAVFGGTRLGRGGVAKAILGVGVVCALGYLGLQYLGFDYARPWSRGWLWVLLAVALVCIVGGLVDLAWVSRGGDKGRAE